MELSLQKCEKPSRHLREGAILVADATQGVQAQTVANAYAARSTPGWKSFRSSTRLILVPSSQPVQVAEEIEHVLGFLALKMRFSFQPRRDRESTN